MIDWLSILVPFRHSDPVDGGRIWVIDPCGSYRESLRWRSAVGSFETSVQVRSHDFDCGAFQYLYVSGNPAKWFQGHNVEGPECQAMIYAFGESVLNVLGFSPDCGREWFCNRIDITRMYDLGTDADCMAWLKAAESRVTVKHRGRGVLDRGTFYVGKHSKRSSLKVYAKGPEVRRHKPLVAPDLAARVLDWSTGKLRFETVWRREELARRGLREVRFMDECAMAELFSGFLAGCGLDMKSGLDVSQVRELPPAWRGIYHQWLAGVDLPQIMSRSTWYRWRKRFQGLGLDLAADPPHGADVVPLVRTLEAVPATVPAWLASSLWSRAA